MERDVVHASKTVPDNRPALTVGNKRELGVTIQRVCDGSTHPVEKKGIACALADGGRRDTGRDLASGARRHQGPRPSIAERRQPPEAPVTGPHQTHARILGRRRPRSKGADHCQRHRGDPPAHEHEEVEGIRVSPVEVVEEEHRRTIELPEPTNRLVEACSPIGREEAVRSFGSWQRASPGAAVLAILELVDGGAEETERRHGFAPIADALPDPEVSAGVRTGHFQEEALAQTGLADDEERVSVRRLGPVQDVADGFSHPVPLPHAGTSTTGVRRHAEAVVDILH
jgi:hypothetical protein